MQTPEYNNAMHDRSIALIGTVESIPDCNIMAMIHEFPTVRIYRANSLTDAVNRLEPPVVAILVDEHCISQTKEFEEALRSCSRERLVAIIVENANSMSEATEALLAGHYVHSIVPMNLRLETWLLALRLLLKGGEFIPTSLGRSHLKLNKRTHQERDRSADRVVTTIAQLTERELQVLHLVASGSSNRHIADQFRLSEHTVKMHVHNLIRKLNAPNRTAAAAIYLESVGNPVSPYEDPFICAEGVWK